MKIEVNGETHTTENNATVSTVLNEIEARADRVAVMLNGKVIHRGKFDTETMSEGDKVDVLILTAGG